MRNHIPELYIPVDSTLAVLQIRNYQQSEDICYGNSKMVSPPDGFS